MFLLSLVTTDADVFLSLGSDSGSEEFVLSPNRWKKIAAAYGIGDIEEPIPVTVGFYDAVSAAAEATRAVREGARILSAGPKSRRELIQKLCSRGVSRTAAGEAADFLTKRGYLNEREQAEALARSLLRRNRYGKLRLRNYLASHGYGAEAVNDALAAISPADLRQALAEILEKRYNPWPAEAGEINKAYAALGRLGYTGEEIRYAVSRLREKQ